MKVVLMGTGTCIPTRNSPGLVVEINSKPIVFDSGSGFLYNLKKAGINYKDIDYMFYSHIHNDHIADIGPFFWCFLHDMPEPRKKDLNLFGPKGLKRYLDKYIFSEIIDVSKNEEIRKGEWSFNVKIKEFENDSFEFDSVIVKSKILKHSEMLNSIGYRIEAEGKVIVYSGDTGLCDEIIELAKDADLLIIECSHFHPVDGHLSPKEIGEIAKKANVKKVILTHMYPDCEGKDLAIGVKKTFNGEVIVGEDLMEINV